MKKALLPPIGFLSYARQDDELAGQKLSKLRELIKAEIQLQYGRDLVKLFQDVTTIPHGAAWESETIKALGESTFFIPIITPHFIQSEWCCRETEIFLKREQQLFALYPDLPTNSRIFPIDYRRIREGNALNPQALDVLKRRQWCPFQDLRDKDPYGEAVSRALYDLAESICDLLLIEVEVPLSPEELAEAEAARVKAGEARRKEAAKVRRLDRQAAKAAELIAERARQGAEALDRQRELRLEAERARQRAEDKERERAEQAKGQAVPPVEEKRSDQAKRAEAEARPAPAEEQRQWNELRDRPDGKSGGGPTSGPATTSTSSGPATFKKDLRRHSQSLTRRRRPLREMPGVVAAALGIAALAIGFVYWLLTLQTTATVAPKPADPSSRLPPPATAPARPVQAWLFHPWGMDGDCSTVMTISAGQANAIRVATGSDSEERPIVGTPSATEVRTAEAIYALRPNGTMRTTERGMSKWVNVRCD